ncbi:hypothetical protein BGZ72_001345 [Mortierella alpina]|nr:hypothetical protein BGZ72_001345 [Mortierella alpina]
MSGVTFSLDFNSVTVTAEGMPGFDPQKKIFFLPVSFPSNGESVTANIVVAKAEYRTHCMKRIMEKIGAGMEAIGSEYDICGTFRCQVLNIDGKTVPVRKFTVTAVTALGLPSTSLPTGFVTKERRTFNQLTRSAHGQGHQLSETEDEEDEILYRRPRQYAPSQSPVLAPPFATAGGLLSREGSVFQAPAEGFEITTAPVALAGEESGPDQPAASKSSKKTKTDGKDTATGEKRGPGRPVGSKTKKTKTDVKDTSTTTID